MTIQPQGEMMDLIKEGLQYDLVAKSLITLAHEGKTRRFWVEDGLLYTKGKRLYVPKWGSARRNLIKECHDSKWAGHPGQRRTRALLESAYYWPQIRTQLRGIWIYHSGGGPVFQVCYFYSCPKGLHSKRDGQAIPQERGEVLGATKVHHQ